MKAVKLVVAALVVLLAAQVSGWGLLDHLFYVLVGLGLVAAIWSGLSLRHVTLERRREADRGMVGYIFVDYLRLSNASRIGKLWVEVDDRSTLPDHNAGLVTSLAGHGLREWTVHTVLSRRGRYQLGPTRLRSCDPFGLFPSQRMALKSSDVLVYPAVVALPKVSLPAGALPGDRRALGRSPYLTPNVGTIRDYAPGDSLNRIAWTPTARRGRLMVKEFDLDPTADVWIVLDMDRSVHSTRDREGKNPALTGDQWRQSTAEFSIVVAASLGVHLLQQQRAVGLVAAGQHHEVIPTDRGPRQVTKLLEALSVIEPNGSIGLGELLTAESARFPRHSLVLIVTPTTDERWTPAIAMLLRGGIRASAVLVDAGTFGGQESPLLLVGQLAALHVPSIVLNCDDDLADSLSQTAAPPPAGMPLALRRRRV